jgi:hypothetical protein
MPLVLNIRMCFTILGSRNIIGQHAKAVCINETIEMKVSSVNIKEKIRPSCSIKIQLLFENDARVSRPVGFLAQAELRSLPAGQQFLPFFYYILVGSGVAQSI